MAGERLPTTKAEAIQKIRHARYRLNLLQIELDRISANGGAPIHQVELLTNIAADALGASRHAALYAKRYANQRMGGA